MKKYIWWWSAGALVILLLFFGIVVSVQMLSPRDGKQGIKLIKKSRLSDAWGYLSTINPPRKWTIYYNHTKYPEWIKARIKEGLPSKISNLSHSEKSSVIDDICRTPAVISAFYKLAKQKIHYHILSEDCRKEKHQQHLAFGDSDYSYLSRKANDTCLKVIVYKMEKIKIEKFQNELIKGYTLKYIAQIEDGKKPHIPSYVEWKSARDKLLAEKRAAAYRPILDMYIAYIYSEVLKHWITVSSSASSCTIQIRLGAQGQLLGVPVILKSNNDARFNHSMIAAVEAAAPFHPPSNLPYSAFDTPIKLPFKYR